MKNESKRNIKKVMVITLGFIVMVITLGFKIT